MGSRTVWMVVGVVIAAIAAPGAQAATRTVLAGTPPPNQEQFQALGSDVNDYFPHRTKIRVGDKVRFVPAGFHTVNLPADEGLVPLFVPTGNKANSTDAAGNPFWFNGQDLLGFNPTLLASNWGEKARYDGSEPVNSGLPLAEKPGAMKVKFTEAGRVEYLCDVHPGMNGVIKVKPKRRRSPSARAHRKTIRREVKRDLAIAEELTQTTIPPGQIAAGLAGDHGVELLAFLPAQTTVPVGSTLTFMMDPDSYEVHTATTGPGTPFDPSTYIGALAASFESPEVDGRALYPSSPPGETIPVSTTAHGNGFGNTGVLDTVAASPLPPNSTVRLDEAGTYDFYCLIHPFMKTTVTAQG